VGRIKTRLPKGGTLALLWLGGIVLLGVVGWGIGWTAHRVLDSRGTPTPTRTARPTVTPAATAVVVPTGPGPTDTPPVPTTAISDGTVQPTSTLLPASTTATPAPPATNEVRAIPVEIGDRGVYDVIRRACGLERDYPLSQRDGIVQETWALNEFVEGSPKIQVGQEIQVPVYLCPGD
jgi:hypothetical protein